MSPREAAGQPFPEAMWLLVALAYAALCLVGLLSSWRLARRARASFEARSLADELSQRRPVTKSIATDRVGLAFTADPIRTRRRRSS